MIISKIDHSTATCFFRRYEHLGNCGLGIWHWGAFISGELKAVVSIGTTCFAHKRGFLGELAQKHSLSIFQISRGGTAWDAPPNTPSWAVSAVLSELRRWKGDCLVVAYADRSFNEVGTIYQACNGLYLGLTDPKDQANYVIHGRKMSGWVVRKKYGTRAMDELRKIDRRVKKMPLNTKYRYLFVKAAPLKRFAIIRELAPLVLPYPNRDEEDIAPMRIPEFIALRGAVGSSMK